jgi:hypothetical protein
MDDLTLLEVLGVANLVDFHSLFRLCSAMAADKIKNMNLDQTRKFLGMNHMPGRTYTPEQDAEIAKTNKWPFPRN